MRPSGSCAVMRAEAALTIGLIPSTVNGFPICARVAMVCMSAP